MAAERDIERGATIARIRNPQAYADGQPDLDVFRPCFDGFTSFRFTGSDIDGIFVECWAGHGLWERYGNVLIQEHKRCPGSWAGARGQWLALNTLAMIARPRAGKTTYRSLSVVVTYGDPNSPTAWQSLPAKGWRCASTGNHFEAMPLRICSLDDVESLPHRKWIRWVSATRDMGG